MTRQEFLGPEFHAWLQQTFDAIRARLKAQQGRPDAVEVQLLRLDREYAATFNRGGRP